MLEEEYLQEFPHDKANLDYLGNACLYMETDQPISILVFLLQKAVDKTNLSESFTIDAELQETENPAHQKIIRSLIDNFELEKMTKKPLDLLIEAFKEHRLNRDPEDVNDQISMPDVIRSLSDYSADDKTTALNIYTKLHTVNRACSGEIIPLLAKLYESQQAYYDTHSPATDSD